MAPEDPLPAGTVVTLRYGEVLNPDGSVSQPWGSGAGINQANQTDQYIARGVDGETPGDPLRGGQQRLGNERSDLILP